MRVTASEQPKQVCWDCGVRYGTAFRDGVSSYWRGRCGVCHQDKSVTEPRDFGYLNRDWKHYAGK